MSTWERYILQSINPHNDNRYELRWSLQLRHVTILQLGKTGMLNVVRDITRA